MHNQHPQQTAPRHPAAWTCFTIGLLLIGFDVTRLTMTGVAIAGVCLLTIWAVAIGVFTEQFWIADEVTSRRLDAVDIELDHDEARARAYAAYAAVTRGHRFDGDGDGNCWECGHRAHHHDHRAAA